MTNYDKKLDEIVRNAYRGELSWIHDQLDGTSFIKESLVGVDKDILITKQAITTLIKELVAEAKPGKRITEADKLRSQGRQIVGSSPFVDAENDAFNAAINQFEHNLLKALEEEK